MPATPKLSENGSSNRLCGFGEGDVKEGDQLALLFPNANVPFILRKNGSCFEMVGVGRIPGRMQSAAVMSKAGEFRDIIN